MVGAFFEKVQHDQSHLSYSNFMLVTSFSYQLKIFGSKQLDWSTGQVAVLQATLPVIEDAEAKFSHSHSNGVSKGSTSNSSSHCHILLSLFKLKILHAYLAPGKSLLKPEQEGLSLLLDCSVY